MKVKVAGKLNLSLNITGSSGKFHTLDSVFTSVDLFDTVEVILNSDGTLSSSVTCADGITQGDGKFELPPSSATLRAAKACLPDGYGARINIEKNLPISGGMGGSSADTAGVICAFEKILGTQFSRLKSSLTALNLGSDTYYMTKGGFARLIGVGEKVEFFGVETPLYFALASNLCKVDTTECYKAFDRLTESGKSERADNNRLISALKNGDITAAAREFENALYLPAVTLQPSLDSVMRDIRTTGAIKAFMTGSGCVCAGLYKTAEQAATASALLSKKGYWSKAVKSLCSGVEYEK